VSHFAIVVNRRQFK